MNLRPCGRKYFSVKLSLRPFGTPSAKQRIPSLLFMLKSNKKPGTPPQWVPDPHRRSKRNKVPLGYPLPSSPFGQYKVPFRHGLPSILLAGCFLFSENFIVYCINVCRRTCAAFLHVVPDLWGRVWKGKPCCPFLGCGGLEPIAKRVPSFCYFLA